MSFDETLEFLREQTGKWVEVAVAWLDPGRDEPVHIAGFSGQVGEVRRGGAQAAPEAWYVWMAEQKAGPSPGQIRLDRELFDEAHVQANVVEEPEERGTSGATWTLTIRQRGVLTSVEVYV